MVDAVRFLFSKTSPELLSVLSRLNKCLLHDPWLNPIRIMHQKGVKSVKELMKDIVLFFVFRAHA